jgi:hypothetical protein
LERLHINELQSCPETYRWEHKVTIDWPESW